MSITMSNKVPKLYIKPNALYNSVCFANVRSIITANNNGSIMLPHDIINKTANTEDKSNAPDNTDATKIPAIKQCIYVIFFMNQSLWLQNVQIAN